MTTAFIALGSNLEDPKKQLNLAIKEISELPGCCINGISSFYENPPVGPQDQPSFINGAIRINTDLEAIDLLNRLQEIEQLHRRVRKIHWGPRTLDLDIILFGDVTINNPRLIVPHVQMENRSFVLKPLLDIDPNLKMPDGRKISDICNNLDCSDLKKTDIGDLDF